MKNATMTDTSLIFKILGDKTRLSMVGLLDLKDCCVCEFVEIFKMSQPAISQHMKRLKDADLVSERRSGQWIIYSLNRSSIYYPLLQDILTHLPNQQDKLDWLKQNGLAITCE